MKNIISIRFIGWILVFFLTYCSFIRSGQPVVSQVQQTSFTEYLNAMVTNYIELKNALVNGNQSQAAKEAREFTMFLKEVDGSSLSAEARQEWINRRLELINNLEQQFNAASLRIQRGKFLALSSKMESLIDKYGPVKQTLYKQYCPKALDGEGAHWLNEKREILNPYGGRDQLHCGEVVEVIKGSS